MTQDSVERPRTASPAVRDALPAIAETRYQEVIDGPGHRDADVLPSALPRIPYPCFSRLIDVCCLAETLRNFNIASLRDDEIPRFLELQSFFIRLESRCLDEAGFE